MTAWLEAVGALLAGIAALVGALLALRRRLRKHANRSPRQVPGSITMIGCSATQNGGDGFRVSQDQIAEDPPKRKRRQR